MYAPSWHHPFRNREKDHLPVLDMFLEDLVAAARPVIPPISCMRRFCTCKTTNNFFTPHFKNMGERGCTRTEYSSLGKVDQFPTWQKPNLIYHIYGSIVDMSAIMHAVSYLLYPRRAVTQSPCLEDELVLAIWLRNQARQVHVCRREGHRGLAMGPTPVGDFILLFGLFSQPLQLKVRTLSLLGQSLSTLRTILPYWG